VCVVAPAVAVLAVTFLFLHERLLRTTRGV
jgi:hypothetical protein